jgi:DNA-binding response OmpR family regulator
MKALAPLQELSTRLDIIRQKANSPHVDRLCDEIEVLCGSHMATESAEIPGVRLSGCQQRMFDLLLSRVGRVVSAESLLDAVSFDKETPPELRTIVVMTCFLRKKLEQANAPYWIETVWGRGFRLIPERLPEANRNKKSTTRFMRETVSSAYWASSAA